MFAVAIEWNGILFVENSFESISIESKKKKKTNNQLDDAIQTK